MTTEFFVHFLADISFKHFHKQFPRVFSNLLHSSAMAPANSLVSAAETCDLRSASARLKTRNSRCRNGVVMKRRARLERRARPGNAVERKVKTLKKLVPNCESMGVERLFRETADYILALQMRVKVMQIVVDAFSAA